MVRWRRYGKDRLYVTDSSDAQVGWIDLQTGVVQLKNVASEKAFRVAVASFCVAHDLALPAPQPLITHLQENTIP